MGILNAVDVDTVHTTESAAILAGGTAVSVALSPAVSDATEPCPVPQYRLEQVIMAATSLGVQSVSLWDAHGHLLASAGTASDAPMLAGHAARVGNAATPVALAPVRVGERLVATVHAFDVTASRDVLHLIAETAAAWVTTLWEDAGEIDNLAREIVHAYEELHLLYELGESLARQFDGAGAADFVLEKIVGALGASFAEIQLTDGTVRTYMSGSGSRSSHEPSSDMSGAAAATEATLTDDSMATHHLETPLRSGGEAIGSLVVGRHTDDEPFTSVENKLLDAVGTLAANAIHNAQLYERARQQANALRESEAYLSAVMNNVGDGIITFDEHGVIRSANPAAEQVFGYHSDEVIGQSIQMLLSDPEAHLLVRHEDLGLTESHSRRVVFGRREVAGRRRDGSAFPVDVAISQMHLNSQRLSILSVRDITERKHAEQRLEHQALHDSLTDLPNRTLLHDRLQQALLAARRNNTSVALLVMDLDRFKEVNDTFGHHYGDLLLQQVGVRLQDELRRSDTVARMGGDEFAMVLFGAELDAAKHTANRLITALERPFFLEGHTFFVGVSVGIALYPEHGADATTLLRRADVAMYLAKRSNNGYAVYTFEQDDHSPDRLALVGELRQAIERDELVLHYQPKIAHEGHKVAWVEALVRWRHPERGVLAPDAFIPLAEQTGLIRPLSMWVLNAALSQCRAWLDADLHLPVAVNLSMRNLHDRDLPAQVAGLLAAHNVPAPLLKLEVTESSLMADPAQAQQVLTELRSMNVHVAIDDFGTGYSSLAYLKNLPIDEIKIDKSFVRHLVSDRNDEAIVRSTIALSHELGFQVVAEGVEDQATWEILIGLGCDLAQGYYFSRPLTALALMEWLSDHQSITPYAASPTPSAPAIPTTLAAPAVERDSGAPATALSDALMANVSKLVSTVSQVQSARNESIR